MKHPRNPVRAARRQTEFREELGAHRPVCIYCGCAEPVALRPISQKLLQEHHVLGQNHDPDLIVCACRNCHVLLHEGLLDAGVNLKTETDPVEKVATMLDAEAVHCEMQASSKRRQAALLRGENQ